MPKIIDKHIVISGVVFLIISQVINTVGAMFTMDYYTDPAYFGLWSDLMMPANDPPGNEFYFASLAVSFVIGIIFAGTYSLVKQTIPGSGVAQGVNFGILLFLVAGVPFTLTVLLLLAIPAALLLFWALSTLVIYLLSGAAFAKLIAG